MEHTPGIPKPPNERNAFINRWLGVWGMFQGYVGKFLETGLLRLQPEKLTIWGDGMAQWCASAFSHAAWVGFLKDGWFQGIKTLDEANVIPKWTNDLTTFGCFLLGNIYILYKWKAMTSYDLISIEGWWFGTPFLLGLVFIFSRPTIGCWNP